MTEAKIAGIHHVVLSVTDLDAAVRWYGEQLDFDVLFRWDTDDFDRCLMTHPSGVVLGLTQHFATQTASVFDPRQPGLDHLSLAVATADALDAWCHRLDAAGIEHSGIKVTPRTGFTLIDFKDPDGIQLELYLSEPAPAIPEQ
ncbi:MAG: VOC family protein [Candidatus Nanopelagicales bacterium]